MGRFEDSTTVTVRCRVVAGADKKAWRVRAAGTDVYIPKSLVLSIPREFSFGSLIEMKIPYWLAKREGLLPGLTKPEV